MTDAELVNYFTYHAPKGDQPERYVRIREAAAGFRARDPGEHQGQSRPDRGDSQAARSGDDRQSGDCLRAMSIAMLR
jgi:hypothetical protein